MIEAMKTHDILIIPLIILVMGILVVVAVVSFKKADEKDSTIFSGIAQLSFAVGMFILVFGFVFTGIGVFDTIAKTYNSPVAAAADGYKLSNTRAEGPTKLDEDAFKNKISKVAGVNSVVFDNDDSAARYKALEKGESISFSGVKDDSKVGGIVRFTKDKMVIVVGTDAKAQDRFEVEA